MRHPDFPVPPRIDAFASWEASLRLAFARRGGRTVLASCRHRGPLRVQKALYPEGEGVCHVVLLHPPAGIAGGDVLDIGIELGAEAHAVLTTPGATKWYKSPGRTAMQQVAIRLDAGARLDWLPQENIVFNQARPIIDLTLDLAPGAAAIGWDITMLGRHAAGESWQEGRIAMHTRLRCEGSRCGSSPRRSMPSRPCWARRRAWPAFTWSARCGPWGRAPLKPLPRHWPSNCLTATISAPV